MGGGSGAAAAAGKLQLCSLALCAAAASWRAHLSEDDLFCHAAVLPQSCPISKFRFL